MGFDKQFLSLNQQGLMEEMIFQLYQSFSDVIVVTNEPAAYRHLPVRLAQDRYRDAGPLAGLEVGLEMAKSEYVFLRACDMPVYQDAYVRYMMACLAETQKVAATTLINGFFEPFNSFYHRSLQETAQRLLESKNRSFRELLKGREVLEIAEETARFFDPDLTHFINLNTKEDLKRFVDLYCI